MKYINRMCFFVKALDVILLRGDDPPHLNIEGEVSLPPKSTPMSNNAMGR